MVRGQRNPNFDLFFCQSSDARRLGLDILGCGGPQAVSLFSFLLSGELLVSFLVCTPDAAVLSVKKENGLRPVSFQVPALHLRAPGCSPEEGCAALRGKSVSPKNGP